MTVEFNNIAGVRVRKNDGNLIPEAAASAPRALVIGTAGRGVGSAGYLVTTTSRAKAEFGTEGTLLRGMWEAKNGGARDIVLYRIGATPAKVTGIGNNGGTGGYIVQTIAEDEDAGEDYALYYDDTEDRLVVIRNSDELVVYDNSADNPIDRYEVVVSGYRASVGGPDIGSPSSFVNLEDIDSSTYPGTSFTAGTDGLSLSRMEMYEKLYVAYEDLKQIDFDAVTPMNVFLDDFNVVDQGSYIGAVTPVVPVGSTYPTGGAYQPGTDVDSLGKLYIEEYEGEYYFWWWFNDGSGSFTGADIYPSAGSATATTTIDGTVLTADDFHEVNFGYQLARFLYEYSTNIVDATGVIAAKAPESNSLVDRSRWYGKAPTWTLNTSTNEYYIASASDNGYGLLGNKFMAGMSTHRSGIFGGGFIATDGQFMDSGEELLDDNEIPIDLGKYISVVIDHGILRTSYSSTSYIAPISALYAGFYLSLPSNSAPTNKTFPNTSLYYKIRNLYTLDDVAGAGYVCLREKTTGTVVADAPTATMPNSDWKRLSTVRIIKDVIDGVRAAVDPFIGNGMHPSTRETMKSAVEKVLGNAKKELYIQDYKPFEIIQTPQMEVDGEASITLTIKPSFELRFVTLTVSVTKSI